MLVTPTTRQAVQHAFARRDAGGHALLEDAAPIARAARDIAARLRRGGKLIAFGEGAARSDAAHIAVEFTHPVIVGRRALPALALTGDTFAHQVCLWAEREDVVLAVCPDGGGANTVRGLAAAAELGLLTVALTGGGARRRPPADHVITARDTDPAVIKEIHVTVYHVLWELVHLFIDHLPEDAGVTRDSCVTCADEALPATVIGLVGDDMALVELGGEQERVSVALVEASAGDTVLVHAGEAIAVLRKEAANGPA